ncbi:MAG: hypothetical protein Q8M29_10000 [Bacteroidota bacterium]|nr:hypothetical protein [Bacteroidota bacterium]
MKKAVDFLYSFVYTFSLLFVLFVPFPYYLFPFQEQVNAFLFTKPLIALSPHLFHIRYSSNIISSDSTLMYTLVIVLFTTALITATFLLRLSETKKLKLYTLIRTLLIYFLAMQLLKYGFDKLFKTQFYLPEPNTLYTPFGMLDKDILYWSTVGVSHGYNVFSGLLEIIAGLLILFRRTRILGLMFAIAILLHICALNFSFDISVKLFSLFLLFISTVLLSPYIKSIHTFFIHKKFAGVVVEDNQSLFAKSKSVKTGIKFFIIGLIVMEALYPAITSGNFNDDKTPRPFMHGAYEVKEVLMNDSLIRPVDFPIKKIFIHRNNYIIFQNQRDEMQDYKLEVDQLKSKLVLTDYSLKQIDLTYSYSAKDSMLVFDYYEKKIKFNVRAKTLNWKKLPALKRGFHFRSDSGN